VAENNMDLLAWLRKQLEEAEPDLLREMVRSFAEALMGAEADALCGAAFRARSGERVNRRNGYRERPFDMRAGSVALAVPKLRSGSYFPTGCWSAGDAPNAPWWRSWPSATCAASRRAASTAWSRRWASRASPRARSRRWPEASTQRSPPSARGPRRGPYTYLWLDALAVRVREEDASARSAAWWPAP